MRDKRWIKFAFVSLLLLLGVAIAEKQAFVHPKLDSNAKPAPEAWRLYDPDPDQIWNRLYRGLCRREGQDGREFGYDELDPLLWPGTKYLLINPANKQAIALLDEFLSTHAERKISDPLKRAILQRDLWAIFDWTAQVPDDSAARMNLQTKLVAVMKRLALSPDEIAALRDTYKEAIKSKAFATAYDPEKREQAFLPRDLFDPKGPWVALSSREGLPVAAMHVDQFSGRSVFRVFINLPEGRAATLNYLQRLSAFPKHLMPDPDNPWRVLPSPNVPQFPAGTQLVLVRELVLIDSRGNLQPTNIVESVQIRIHRTIPGDVQQVFNSSQNDARAALDVYEFKLSRTKLFAGESGGLRSVAEGETEFALFLSHGIDFESRVSLRACSSCHFRPGIFGVLSRGGNDVPSSQPDQERNETKWWKGRRYDWGFLQGLWRSEPGAINQSDQ